MYRTLPFCDLCFISSYSIYINRLSVKLVSSGTSGDKNEDIRKQSRAVSSTDNSFRCVVHWPNPFRIFLRSNKEHLRGWSLVKPVILFLKCIIIAKFYVFYYEINLLLLKYNWYPSLNDYILLTVGVKVKKYTILCKIWKKDFFSFLKKHFEERQWRFLE